MLLFILMLFSCKSYPKIVYGPSYLGDRIITNIKSNDDKYKRLLDEGSTFDVEISQVNNDYFSRIAFRIFSLYSHTLFTVHEIDFYFDDQNKKIKINKKMKLKKYQTKKSITVDDDPTNILTIYFTYLGYDKDPIRLYFDNIFQKKKQDIGDEFKVLITVFYSLDRGEILSQKLEYTMLVDKGWYLDLSGHTLLYILFPGSTY
jgi:hypothetical protein